MKKKIPIFINLCLKSKIIYKSCWIFKFFPPIFPHFHHIQHSISISFVPQSSLHLHKSTIENANLTHSSQHTHPHTASPQQKIHLSTESRKKKSDKTKAEKGNFSIMSPEDNGKKLFLIIIEVFKSIANVTSSTTWWIIVGEPHIMKKKKEFLSVLLGGCVWAFSWVPGFTLK